MPDGGIYVPAAKLINSFIWCMIKFQLLEMFYQSKFSIQVVVVVILSKMTELWSQIGILTSNESDRYFTQTWHIDNT